MRGFPLFCLASLLLCGCFSRTSAMTQENYENVVIGTTTDELEDSLGRPYAVHPKGGGTEEYEYVEKIDLQNGDFFENHYFVVLTDGRVVAKYTTHERSPAYNLIYEEDPNVPY